MHMKIISIIIIVTLLFLASCTRERTCEAPLKLINETCCEDTDDDRQCDSAPVQFEERVEPISTTEVEYGRIILDELEVEKTINQQNVKKYSFYTDSLEPTHRISDQERHIDIETRMERIYEPEEFLRFYGAPAWDGYTFYINQSRLRFLHEPLQDKDLRDFRSYKQRRMLVERRERENAYILEHGVVLEYQLLFFQYDQFGNYKGPFEESVVLYKVYCSPEYIVILRPEWVEGMRTIAGAGSVEAMANFDLEMAQLRPRMLNRADELLEYCSPPMSFFLGLKYVNTDKTTMYAYDEQIYLERFAQIVSSVGVELRERAMANRPVTVEKVTLRVTNNDSIPLEGPLYLDITAIIDGKSKKEVASDKRFGSRIVVGDFFERTFEPLLDISFMSTITLDVRLRRESDNAVIKPMLVTFNRKGEIIDEESLFVS